MNCAYLRYSPRPGGQSESCELQLERIQAWAKSQGQEIDCVYRDENKSGGSQEGREGLASALDAVCKAKGTLCCYSLSRLARNTADALQIAERLRQSSAGLVLLDLGLDTRTALGRCVYTILSAVAELERNQISERTSDAMKRHQRNGRRMSRYAPYGYNETSIKGVWRDSESEQRNIRYINLLRERGDAAEDIAKTLNENGSGYRGRRWKSADVRRILERNSH